MKRFLKILFWTWLFVFATDYIGAQMHFKKETCESFFEITAGHTWFHVVFPGWGNACLDRGVYPK